ncbi:MAG TPA: class I tRNA ligase family protein [Terracidiphilus sp.]|nr:class I tRNA ligase family protein [Terracidiphilus sp.]
MSPTPELKATLTLPQTAFPMKANLPQNEPLRLARWAELRLYEELRKAGHGRPAYLLHDGPPYANGPIHLGHALNKGLKDFVVKSKTMAGFDAPYVPGFDCHGLPIEIKVDEKLGRKKLEMPAPAVLDACRAYAQKYVDQQTEQFERIGCFGRWQKPYKTMARSYEARTLEAFYGFLEGGFVYRGLKPVYWCIHDRTALAEAEVEYEQHTSPSIYVRYRLTSDPKAISPALAGRDVSTIIWTTTPWTLPASLAVAFHPDFDYVALEIQPGAPSSADDAQQRSAKVGEVYIVAAELATQVVAACSLGSVQEIARFKGSALDRVTFRHPFLDRSVLGVLATYVTADTGTGAVHTAPSHGADDFYTGLRYGLDPTTRVDASGHIHVDAAAWPHATPPPFDGLNVWKANPVIIEILKSSGALMGLAHLEHSYPHCWRCHHPIIFRATEQWFISLDTPMQRADGSEIKFRDLAIEEIDKVVWDPAWGKERITNMIATRPDWCISRQRIWGVPIAVFLCEGCNQPILDAALNRKIVDLFDREGVEAWHTTHVAALLPAGTKCASCGSASFRKETDILDVWFDSGVSWFAVCESDPELRTIYKSFQAGAASTPSLTATGSSTECQGTTSVVPNQSQKYGGALAPTLPEGASENSPGQSRAQRGGSPGNAAAEMFQSPVGATESQTNRTEVLYLEGGDQHRGWFHSSLLTSVALRGRAPYSHVATAGWTLDEQGRAMSKSLGNGVDPVDIANRMGGEIVRLWVASVDFREDMAASENLMARCAELYKKLRNTFRFLLGNLQHSLPAFGIDGKFDPARDRAAESELLPLDRYMLAKTRELAEKIVGPDGMGGWYAAFEFHRIYHAVNEFAIVDLSAFYLDVLKDRMYTFAPTSHARRSAQTVLWQITEALVRLVAPILTFTADEVWEYLPKVEGREASVHLARFPKPEEIFSEDPANELITWRQLLLPVRNRALLKIEELRKNKKVGKSLECDLNWLVPDHQRDVYERYLPTIAEITIVSDVRIVYLPQKQIEERLLAAQVVDTERGATESPLAWVANLEQQLANPDDARLAIWEVEAVPANGDKCNRCWRYTNDVADYGIWRGVCARCRAALHEMGIDPPQTEDAA